MLKHITIEGVRNLVDVQLALPAGATVLFGANGSGKTSFLEAIHLLAVGRSFRTLLSAREPTLTMLLMAGGDDYRCVLYV